MGLWHVVQSFNAAPLWPDFTESVYDGDMKKVLAFFDKTV